MKTLASLCIILGVLFVGATWASEAAPFALRLATNGDVSLSRDDVSLGLRIHKTGWTGTITGEPVLEGGAGAPGGPEVVFRMKDDSGAVCVTGCVALAARQGQPARSGALGDRALPVGADLRAARNVGDGDNRPAGISTSSGLSLRAAALTDIRTECLAMEFSLPAKDVSGLEWRVGGGARGVFPEKYGEMRLWRGVTDSFSYVDPATREPVELRFPQPMRLLLQDSRLWGPNFSVRIEVPIDNCQKRQLTTNDTNVNITKETSAPLRLCVENKQIPNGAEFAFDCTISHPDGIAVERDEIVVVEVGPDWIPLNNRKDIVAGSALDFSMMGWTDAPAGKYGWLKAVGGHFEFEGLPGVAQRFYGVNLCQSANFPDHAMAEELVTRLKRLGYNSIRFHHHDGALAEVFSTQRRRDAEKEQTDLLTPNGVRHTENVSRVSGEQIRLLTQETPAVSAALREESNVLDRFDYLAAVAIENGLYLTTDLYVSRKVAWRDIGFDRDGFVPNNVFKSLVAFHEQAFENWAAFARDFLLHENPYTGRRYVDEPGMPLICLVNEGPMKWAWSSIRTMDCVKEKWREWRMEGDPAAIENFMDSAVAQRFAAFVEREAFEREKRFLESLGCKALLTSQNCSDSQAMAAMRSDYDYVDNHCYLAHPQFLGKLWSGAFKLEPDGNPARAESGVLVNAAFTRIAGKPYTLMEWNLPGPEGHRAAGALLMGAMAARQDWSGLWRFAYSHVERSLVDGYGTPHLFDLAVDPVNLASERAVMCLFLRGDMAPLETRIALDVGAPRLTPDGKPAANRPEWMDEAWNIQVGRVVGKSSLFTIGNCQKRQMSINDTNQNTNPVNPVNDVSDKASAPLRLCVENNGSAFPMDAVKDAPPVAPEDRPDFTIDRAAGTVLVATPRTCGVFAEGGAHEAGPLQVDILTQRRGDEWKEQTDLLTPNGVRDTGNVSRVSGEQIRLLTEETSASLRLCVNNASASATVFVLSLDGERIETSSRILVTHLTDAQADGNVFADRARSILLKWGKGRTLVRNGAARVSLALDNPESCEVWGLATDGTRMERVPAVIENGRLSFNAEVDSGHGARLFYEIARTVK